MKINKAVIILRGGGDLASGVAVRCSRAGFRILITEIQQPLAVRRTVAFAEAIYAGAVQVEEVTGRRVSTVEEVYLTWEANEIPVLRDPDCAIRFQIPPTVLVDARMTKQSPDLGRDAADLVIGLGPGFTAGINCHAVVETNRGHFLGRVIWDGAAQADTGVPESVSKFQVERVLRSPADGILSAMADIGSIVEKGEPVARVGEQVVNAPFRGLLRGMIHPGISVKAGMKIGDLDPRCNPRYTQFVSEKSLAIAGGVLEAILSKPELRSKILDANGSC